MRWSGVNLLWCLPGRRRGFGGVPRASAHGPPRGGAGASTPRCSCCPGSPPPTATWPRSTSSSSPRSTPGAAAAVCWPRPRGCRAACDGVDVVHHAGGTVPPRSPGPIVLTIHDLQYRTYPGYLTSTKRRYLQVSVPRSVHRARVVTVPTRYVRDTVVEAFGTDPERVVVVPHGVDPPSRVDGRGDAAAPSPPRTATIRRLPGHHPPAQEPPAAVRPAGGPVGRP